MGSTGKKGSSSSNPGATITSTSTTPLTPNVTITPANQNNPQVAQQAPSPANTPVTPDAVDKLTQMSDDELAALMNAAKKAVLPNYLADDYYDSYGRVNKNMDKTQKFVYQAGINEKPMVLDKAEFDQYLKDKGIPNKEIIARSVNGNTYKNQQGYDVTLTSDQIQDILKYSSLTYIGGKHGGNLSGSGAYFAMTGGSSTSYGANTVVAVLNPDTAKVINRSTLASRASTFMQSHPKFTKAVGKFGDDTMSIYALAMGYNVITPNSTRGQGAYYNVIDRKALVYLK